jgi:hypothetical protein
MSNNKDMLYSYYANDPGMDTVDKFFSRTPGFEGVSFFLFKSLGLIIKDEYGERSIYGYINGEIYEIFSYYDGDILYKHHTDSEVQKRIPVLSYYDGGILYKHHTDSEVRKRIPVLRN